MSNMHRGKGVCVCVCNNRCIVDSIHDLCKSLIKPPAVNELRYQCWQGIINIREGNIAIMTSPSFGNGTNMGISLAMGAGGSDC